MKVCISGAGIAGLWLHNRLQSLGFSSVLIDVNPIGTGQTLSAQGIIHGGIKYSLSGTLSPSANAIAGMPQCWRDCITGNGVLNLSQSTVLAEYQYLWSEPSLASKVTGFFSSKAVRGKMTSIAKPNAPSLFNNHEFKGKLYQLNEPVLDTLSLVENLVNNCSGTILQVPDYTFVHDDNGRLVAIRLSGGELIEADHFVLTAGEGNEALINSLKLPAPKMQRRPLSMVLLKSPKLPNIYAHCVGASSKPLLTISSHQHSDGDTVWYLGGGIAEDGVGKDADILINESKQLLHRLLPWLDISHAQWAVHEVNRAEPQQQGLLRPDTAFLESHQNIHVAWPTKLALAPVLADKVIAKIGASANSNGSPLMDSALSKRYQPTIAKPLWDRVFK